MFNFGRYGIVAMLLTVICVKGKHWFNIGDVATGEPFACTQDFTLTCVVVQYGYQILDRKKENQKIFDLSFTRQLIRNKLSWNCYFIQIKQYYKFKISYPIIVF